MTILYCSLITKEDRILLAESTKSDSYHSRVSNLLNTIFKSSKPSEKIEIEERNILTYLRTKTIVFIVIAKEGINDDRSMRFMKQFVALINSEFGSVDQVLPSDHKLIKKHFYQTKLEAKFVKLLENIETGMYSGKDREMMKEMNNDLEEIKKDVNIAIKKTLENTEDLNELLITSKNIKLDAKVYKEDAKALEKETRCCKPWMIIVTVLFLLLIGTYITFAIVRCGNLNAFCDLHSH